MITTQELRSRREDAYAMFRRAGLFVTATEKDRIEIADFGLGEFTQTGLAVLVYVNTSRCCAKELAMWPRQTCPEHRHPPVGADPGKEETFRCRWGRVYLYVSGDKTHAAGCSPPAAPAGAYTVWHEVVLNPGEQHTIEPGTLHWFQAGEEGCVVSEFSTRSTDENDVFSDSRIERITKVLDGTLAPSR
jgi:D-lyxose ketol-isomerase